MQVDLPGLSLEVGRDCNGDPCITDAQVTDSGELDGWLWDIPEFQKELDRALREDDIDAAVARMECLHAR